MGRSTIPWAGFAETPVASAARTATGDSGVLNDYGPFNKIRAQLDCTAASGTSPTLDVIIEDTIDGTNYNTVGTFAQLVTTGREVIDITTPFSDRLRITHTITGTTPSFTFSVKWNIERE